MHDVLVLGASHPFCGLPRFASRASDCGSPFRAVLVLGASHPFFAACPALRRRLRTAVALSGLSSSSMLRTLFFAACPALRRRLRTALPLRGVLVLGASHPSCGPPRFASRPNPVLCLCSASLGRGSLDNNVFFLTIPSAAAGSPAEFSKRRPAFPTSAAMPPRWRTRCPSAGTRLHSGWPCRR